MLLWLIVAIFVLFHLKLYSNIIFIIERFKIGNCIVFGKKRKGKDLLFQNVIAHRKKKYFSTIDFGYKSEIITLGDISLKPNTYDHLINNKVIKTDKIPDREKRDIYISDGGNYLPSQYRRILEKTYPSTPLYYSLSGHLYDSNVHVNYNGSFTRVWDKLREQADYYFRALATLKMPFALYTKIRFYEEPQAAEENVLPFKKSMINGGEVRAAKRQYKATYGLIKDMWVRIPKRKIKYDTRAFEKIFFTKKSLENFKNNKPMSIFKLVWVKLKSLLFRKSSKSASDTD